MSAEHSQSIDISKKIINEVISIVESRKWHDLPKKNGQRQDGSVGILTEALIGAKGGNSKGRDSKDFEVKSSTGDNDVTLHHKEADYLTDLDASGKRVVVAVNRLHKSLVDANPGASKLSTFTPFFEKYKTPRRDGLPGIYDEVGTHGTNNRFEVDATGQSVTVKPNKQFWPRGECPTMWAHWKKESFFSHIGMKGAKMIHFKAIKTDTQAYLYSADIYSDLEFESFYMKIGNDIIIGYDANYNPHRPKGKSKLKNHGTKFRIDQKRLPTLYKARLSIFPCLMCNEIRTFDHSSYGGFVCDCGYAAPKGDIMDKDGPGYPSLKIRREITKSAATERIVVEHKETA